PCLNFTTLTSNEPHRASRRVRTRRRAIAATLETLERSFEKCDKLQPMDTPLHVAILAAGEGKRMHSDLPKVLHCLAGRPLLAHVLDSARALDASSLCVVHGHGGEQVRERFADANVAWARQDPPLGTAHALAQALPHFSSEGVTLVLYGDVALVRPSTLASVVERARSGALSLLTVD